MDTAALSLIYRVDQVIINPLIEFLFAIAMIYFIWGVYKLWVAGSPDERAQGSRHVLWGIVGLVIMIGVFTLIHVIMKTIGVTDVPTTLPQ